MHNGSRGSFRVLEIALSLNFAFVFVIVECNFVITTELKVEGFYYCFRSQFPLVHLNAKIPPLFP